MGGSPRQAYGTPKAPVETLLRAGRDVLFDIDYQGTQQIRARARDDVATIFILPPSMRELRARLERRAEDSPDTIAKRLAASRNEITRWTSYDYVVSILGAERLRRERTATAVAGFVDKLAAE